MEESQYFSDNKTWSFWSLSYTLPLILRVPKLDTHRCFPKLKPCGVQEYMVLSR